MLIVKLNEGVGGIGNALVNLGALPAPGDPAEKAAATEALPRHAIQVVRRQLCLIPGTRCQRRRHCRGTDPRPGPAQPQRSVAGDAPGRGRDALHP